MKLTDKASVKGVIASMTLEDKLRAIQGATMFKTMALPEYGIPAAYMLDGSTGMCFRQATLEAFNALRTDGRQGLTGIGSAPGFDRREEIIEAAATGRIPDEWPETLRQTARAVIKETEKLVPDMELPGCFPPGMLLGATWEKTNVYDVGVALGREAQFYGIDVLLGPNVNIHRDPLNGRLFEGYSEDPCLAAALAPEMVKGVQSEGVISNPKHFAANNQETNRREVDEQISERALREIYLPGFEACVKAGAKSVMSAYNLINGVPCAHNSWLLNHVLRDEWGFDGFVVSDWGAVYDQVAGINGGNDIEMPASGKGIDALLKAVEAGIVEEATIDRALERWLNQLVDAIAIKGRKYTRIDREFSRRAVYNSDKEGFVLLKNNGVLPFDQGTDVCCWGEKCKEFVTSGGGSANVVTDQRTGMYDELALKLGSDRVTFEEIRSTTAVVVITVCSMGREGFDRKAMEIDPEDREVLTRGVSAAKAAGKKVVLILNVCGPVDLRDTIDQVDAVLCVFYPGMEGGRVAAEILTGEINPSGKLPLTFPKRYEDCPSSIYFPGRNLRTDYGEGIFVGYRWYDYHNIEPMFSFGFGLSYTSFEITDARLERPILNYDHEDLTLSVTVRNTGKRSGKEVVQVYIGQHGATLIKPVKELKAFEKIEIEPGKEKTLSFSITKDMLRSFDEEIGGWAVEPGQYTAYIGTSSVDIAFELPFEARGWNSFGFSGQTRLDVLAVNSEAFDLMRKYVGDGAITVNQVREMVLFQKAPTVEAYWNSRFDSSAEVRYREMIGKLNTFCS